MSYTGADEGVRDAAEYLSSDVVGGLPGPSTQPVDHGLTDLRRHTDLRGARLGGRRHVAVDRERPANDDDGRGRSRRPAVLRAATDDPVPAEVPAVVVRLEPGTA